MGKEVSLRQDKRIKAHFHAALHFLIDTFGYRQQEVADIIGRGYTCSNVNHWLLRNQTPRDDTVIMRIITWGIALKLLTETVIPAANSKMDELTQGYEHTLNGCLDLLKARGESYADIAGVDTTDTNWPPKLCRWHKGENEPRQREGADAFREALTLRGSMPNKVVNSMAKRIKVKVTNKMVSQIMGRVATETGLGEEIYYSLFPIFEPLGDLPDLSKTVSDWPEWCADYEKSQGLATAKKITNKITNQLFSA
jgi:hypothetical protein